jgi:hypothetical protein
VKDVAEDVPYDGDPDECFELDEHEGNDVDGCDEEGRGQVDEERGVDGVPDLNDILDFQKTLFQIAKSFYKWG